MALADFSRHPLTVRAEPGPSARSADRAPRRRPHLDEARGLNSGLAFGGNKTRKLEYLVPDALAKGADTLVSIGGVSPITPARSPPLPPIWGWGRLVQERWVDWPDSVNDRVGNILLSRLMDAHVGSGGGVRHRLQESRGSTPLRMSSSGRNPVRDPGRRLRSPARRPRIRELGVRGRRAGGGAGRVLRPHRGLLGDRVDARGHDRRLRRPRADFGGRPRRVLGIDASAKIDETRDQVARIARNTAALIDLGRELRDDEITVLDGWAGDFYGIPVESTAEAMRLTGRLEGVILDPVYEGKSMAGLSSSSRPATSRRTRTCSTRTSAASPRSTLQRPLPPRRPETMKPTLAEYLLKLQRDEVDAGMVRLRRWRPSDVDALYGVSQDPGIQQWRVISAFTSRSDVEEFISAVEPAMRAAGSGAMFGLVDRDDGGVLGMCGLAHLDLAHRVGEIGYCVAPNVRGRGVATAAVTALAAWAFDRLDLERLEWNCGVGNAASRAVAAKVGFRFEGTARAKIRKRDGIRLDAWTAALLPTDVRPTVPLIVG